MTNSLRVASFESFKLSFGNQPPPSIPISLCALIRLEVTSQKSHRHSDSKAEATTYIFIKVCRKCFPGVFLSLRSAPVPSPRPQHLLRQYNTCPPSAHAQGRPGCVERLAWQPCIEDSVEHWLLQKWEAHRAGAGSENEAKACRRPWQGKVREWCQQGSPPSKGRWCSCSSVCSCMPRCVYCMLSMHTGVGPAWHCLAS
jgi:hypothetical protein